MDYEPEVIDGIMRRILFREWTEQLERGALSYRGITALRGRLDAGCREFLPGDDLDTMRLRVDVALADTIGVALDELPGRAPMDHVPESWS
jgi:hypothetical protein